MSFNPFEQRGISLDQSFESWTNAYPVPYHKDEVDPYTKVRIILMNGTEYEAVWFSHQFHRHCPNNDLRRELALARRVAQQQQKRFSCLKPIDETPLELSPVNKMEYGRFVCKSTMTTSSTTSTDAAMM